jgi:hypothetical protein
MSFVHRFWLSKQSAETAWTGSVKAWFLNFEFFQNNKEFDELLKQNNYWDEIIKKYDKSINVDRFMNKKNLFLKKLIGWYRWIYETYIISPLSSSDKFSGWYANCQGIVWVWNKDWWNL